MEPVKQGKNRRGTFKKGDSRINRRGRPKLGETMGDALRGNLSRGDREAIARKVIEMAKGGYLPAISFVFERLDGKVKDTLEVEGGGVLKVVEEIVDADGGT